MEMTRRVRQGVVIAVVYAAVALPLVFAGRAGSGAASIWIANGLLLGWLLRRDARAAPVALMLCLLADAGTRLVIGVQPLVGIGLAIADMAEVAVAWTLLRHWRLRAGDALVERGVPSVLAGALLAPVIGAALSATTLHFFAETGWRDGFLSWWPGHALALLAVTPVVLAWDRSQLRRLLAGDRARMFWPMVVVVPLVCLGLWMTSAAVLLVPLAMLVVAGSIRVLGTALLGLLAVIVTVSLVIAGSAPTSGWIDAMHVPVAIQVGLATALGSLAPLLVSLLARQRDIAAQRAQVAGERMRTIAQHTPGLIAQLDRDLRYRYVNPGYLQWHGVREEDVLGRTPRDFLGEAQVARLTSRMHRALAGQPQQFELPMPDGRRLRARYEPQFGDDGVVEGFYMLAEDISWRGQAEQRVDALLAAADAMFVVDEGGRVVQINAGAVRLFGGRREDLVGALLANLLTEPSREPLHDAIHALRHAPDAEATGDWIPLYGRDQEERIFPIDLRLSRLAGEVPLMVAAIRDTGEQAQLALALQQEQAVAQRVLGAVGDAVVACDAARLVTSFNPVAEDLTGWRNAEAVGQPIETVLRLVDQASGRAMLSPLEMALNSNAVASVQPDSVLLRRDGVRSPIEASAAPVHDADGNLVGAVMVFHDVSESRAMAMKMSHLAQHDYLTDLPNRVLLHDRLAQALAAAERGQKGALLFVDLDFFKNINDTLGHQAGDKVLQEVARRLVDVVRADDTVSRQGGDEFVLLLVRLADPRDAARVAEKLILAIEQPFHVEGQALHISASVGIALFPQDARDVKTLMKQADTALYHAKQSGRGRYSYFTGVMSEKAEQRMRMEHDLRLALANEDFFLVYQPKVMQPEGRVTGMEALVRWRRCDTGEVVPPDQFIPVAEETGLIVALDEWVMREACRQNHAWQQAGLASVPVSVNVSLARFDPDRLITHVRKVLADTCMDPRCLEIEFTESQMFTHLERAQLLIAQLKELGVHVTVDDFGTGYSGLGYLMRYKFDVLKIDRSFVQGLPDDPAHTAIVRAIIGMAHALDCRVVAEGVETFAQADVLQAYGCHEMQGYLYSRPVPADEFAVLLRRMSITHPQRPEGFPRRA